jgi:hypothetical protein
MDLKDIWGALVTMLLAIMLFEAARSISCAMAGDDPVVLATTFVQKIMFKGVLEAINDVFSIQVFYSMYNTFSLRPHEAVWTWTYKIAPGADGIANVCGVIGYALVAVFGSLSAQLALLSFIDATMYTFMLPAGILMRFFPPTRDAGVFLIALAIGFQVIFPMTYVLNKMALDNIWVIMDRGTEYTPYVGGFSMGIWKVAFLGSGFPVAAVGTQAQKVVEMVRTSLGVPLPGVAPVLGFATSEITVYNLMFGLFKPILEGLAELSLVSLFLPSLAMTLTFAFINAMTKLMLHKV